MTSWWASDAGPDHPTRPRVRMTQWSASASARWTNCSMSTTVMPDCRASVEALEHRFGHHGGETERHLVGDDELGRDGQGAGQRQHLLLPARQRPRSLRGGAHRARERARWPVDGRVALAPLELLDGHAQVFDHGESGEDAPAFRDVSEPVGAQLVGRPLGDVDPVEADATRGRRDQPGHGRAPACSCRRRWRPARRPSNRLPPARRHRRAPARTRNSRRGPRPPAWARSCRHSRRWPAPSAVASSSPR